MYFFTITQYAPNVIALLATFNQDIHHDFGNCSLTLLTASFLVWNPTTYSTVLYLSNQATIHYISDGEP